MLISCRASLSVLVADDDPIVAAHAAMLLRRYGVAAPMVATSVEEARSLIAQRTPDLVFCDIQMPGEDGFDLLETLEETCPGIGILIYSAYQERIMLTAADRARCLGFRWVAHTPKPLSEKPLFDLLDAFSQEFGLRLGKESRQMNAVADLSQGEYVAWYQPLVYANELDRLFAIEALVRWRSADHIIHPPVAFMHIVDREGLEMSMLQAILPPSLELLSKLRVRWPDLRLAFNVSPNLLANRLLIEVMLQACERYLLPLTSITLELTEAPASEHAQWSAMQANAARIRMLGMGLSIDDFGTRESSVERVLLLPVSEVKVDKLFVHAARRSSNVRAILEALRTIAGQVGAITVVEGVETEEDMSLAREMRFDIAQGFFIAWPLEASELLNCYG